MFKEKHLNNLFWYFLICATFIQAIFALIWVNNNLGIFFEERLANNYIEAAKTLKVNDYMGIGYAILVRALGHGYVLYVVQAISVFFSAVLFSSTVVDSYRKWLVGTFVITNPYVLQAIFSVLPGTFSVALVLLTAYALSKRNICLFIVVDICLGFMNFDYAIISVLVLIPLAIYRIVKKERQALALLGSAILVFATCFSINWLVTDHDAYGAVKKTIPLLCMQRIVQGHLTEYENVISSYYGIDMSQEMLAADRVSDSFVYDFAQEFEKRVGDKAGGTYKYITKLALKKGVGYNAKPIIRDYAYYFLSPMSIHYIWKCGKTDSLIASPLYDFVKKQTVAAKLYAKFAIYTYYVCFALSICYLIAITLSHPNEGMQVKRLKAVGRYLYLIGVLSLYGTFMCNRGFDYRNSLVIIITWLLIIISVFGNRKEKE